jgi:hypothetical protein
MFDAIFRKARQFIEDPVLRHWALTHPRQLLRPERAFTPHCPPYLESSLPLSYEPPTPVPAFKECPQKLPDSPFELNLAGAQITIEPGGEDALFERTFDDLETLLALHRFAWIPVHGQAIDPAWVQALWGAWSRRYAIPSASWPWHPYTATERALNILAFADTHGLPSPTGDTLEILATHGLAIAGALEYFGENGTSNHLSNNGRGLYILGLRLGMKQCADLGARILVAEAKRIFLSSGILREGSTHYHLLLARNYLEAWLASHRHQGAEKSELEAICRQALSVIPALVLSGGMPLVGDVSPDSPPTYLECLLPGGPENTGWMANLPKADRERVLALRQSLPSGDEQVLKDDGWLRGNFGLWSALWHVAPDGWAPIAGHGHQDCGGFEVHFDGEPVFIDLGRGAYGETAEAAAGRAGRSHNTVIVDNQDPYPTNRPYYDDAYRRSAVGSLPLLSCKDNCVTLRHEGFSRLRGIGALQRRWQFNDNKLTIFDHLEGNGHHLTQRFLHTTLPVSQTDEGAIVRGRKHSYRVSTEGGAKLHKSVYWPSYGTRKEATTLVFAAPGKLPMNTEISVEIL